MKILTDVHTHTNASAHAYSTLYENMCSARDKGLELVAMTNHSPSMPDSPHFWHYLYFAAIPRVVEGVKLICGAEVNVVNMEAELDMPKELLSKMDIVIASIHGFVYDGEAGKDHTKTWLKVIDTPYVDILGHCGAPEYPFDIDTVVKYAKEKNVCIEINNHSFVSRPQNIRICREIAIACKKHNAPIVVNSDAHFMSKIGDVGKAVKMLEEIDFPENLIMNLNAERFIEYLSNKKNRTFSFEV